MSSNRERNPNSISMIAALAIALVALPGLADWESAWNAYRQGDCKTAVSEAGKVIESHPNYAPALHVYGDCQLRLKQQSALQYLRRANELDPDNQRYTVTLAQGLLREGGYEEAFSLLEGLDLTGISEQERTSVAMLTAQAALASKRYAAALMILQAHADGGTRNASFYRSLGLAYQGQKIEDERCYDAFRRAFELDTNDDSCGRMAVNLARNLARSATGEEAQRFTRDALGLAEKLAGHHPSHKHHQLAGEAAYDAGSFDVAATWLRKAQKEQPGSLDTLYYLGCTLANLDQNDEAIEHLSAALQKKPEAGRGQRIHLQLGKLKACRLELKEAADHYRQSGDAQRATEIDGIADSSKVALEQLEKLRGDLGELQKIEQGLSELGEQDGVKAIRTKMEEARADMVRIEQNLAEVRAALCS